jgi:hypothetical protein
MNQVSFDWNSTALVSLTVTNESICPTDYPEIVFGRHWYGTDIGCDCVGVNKNLPSSYKNNISEG